MQNKIKVFENKQVRTLWNADEEEWYFFRRRRMQRFGGFGK